jgi:hypothetical protein
MQVILALMLGDELLGLMAGTDSSELVSVKYSEPQRIADELGDSVSRSTVCVEPGCPSEENYRRNDRSVVELSGALRRGAERDLQIQKEEYKDEGKENVFTDPVLWPCCADIQPNTYAEHCNFNDHCAGDRVPKSKPIAPVSAWIKWQVRTMGDPVKNPMARRAKPNYERTNGIRLPEVINQSEQRGPSDRHEKDVGPRKVLKIERDESSVAWCDTCVLPS